MFVPDLAGSVALDWSMNLGSALRLATTLETVYSGAYFPQATLDPATEQDAYFKYNARIALMSQKGSWEVFAERTSCECGSTPFSASSG